MLAVNTPKHIALGLGFPLRSSGKKRHQYSVLCVKHVDVNCIHFTHPASKQLLMERSKFQINAWGLFLAWWSFKIKRRVGVEGEMHSTALSKSGFYWLLPRAGERDGGVEDEGRELVRSWYESEMRERKCLGAPANSLEWNSRRTIISDAGWKRSQWCSTPTRAQGKHDPVFFSPLHTRISMFTPHKHDRMNRARGGI